jgi:queuine tRNA-ribosyltransferase
MTTARGQIQTPVFMPVGTLATVKSLDTKDIEDLGAQIILGNTYHLYLRPGTDRLQQVGGMHGLMNWSRPILTDSGGFQVFSLGKQIEGKTHDEMRKLHPQGKLPNIQSFSTSKITDEGVHFTSHIDGTKHFFTPEKSIEIQQQIGADIIMAFDECTPDQADAHYTREALDRTHRWARQSVAAWENRDRKSVYGHYQALFGIVQGAMHRELREESAQFMSELPVDGLAVGGETIGYNMAGTVEVMSWLQDILPADKPRYAMGLGRDPQNLIDAVLAGFDMFDCVGPTRLARNGTLYFGKLEEKDGLPFFDSPYNKARLQIGNLAFATDNNPIDVSCDCYTCRAGYSRAYLHHLFRTSELTYYRLASIHNVRVMVRLSEELRSWLERQT